MSLPSKNRLVVYTCVCGAYDAIQAPEAVCPGVDYICFSDIPFDAPVWQYRPAQAHGGPTDTSRWHKLNPHLILPEYEYSLWIDGNVTIASADLYERVTELMDSGCLYAGLSHPSRDDVYEEAEAILKGRREGLLPLMRVTRFLHSEGFPRHYGLMETNVVLRAHNTPQIKEFDTLWWKILSEYTHRDQMSQMYCLWRCGLQPELLLPAGCCARNHPAFRYTGHGVAYLKDRSLCGRCADAACALRKAVFRTWLRLLLH